MSSWLSGVVAVLGLLLTLGCGGPQDLSKPREESNLKHVSILYGKFIQKNKGQPPANEAAFKAFISALSPEELRSAGVETTEGVLISNRDNQPYVVVYGPATGPATGPGNRPVIAYEQTGIDGKRFVATDLGGVEEVDEIKFKELVPNPK